MEPYGSSCGAGVLLSLHCTDGFERLFIPCPNDRHFFSPGITEAFVHAVLDERGLRISNIFMLISAALHMFISVVLINAGGAVGLVMADGINMVTRITFSLWLADGLRSFGNFKFLLGASRSISKTVEVLV